MLVNVPFQVQSPLFFFFFFRYTRYFRSNPRLYFPNLNFRYFDRFCQHQEILRKILPGRRQSVLLVFPEIDFNYTSFIAK